MVPEPSLTAPWREPGWMEQSRRILDSYRRWLGVELLPRTGSVEGDAAALFAAPFVVVSHGTEADPILNYGNRQALELWEMDVATLLQTPSRLTAEPMHRDERARLLARTTRDGYVDDYRGIRISRTGRRFQIDRAVVWNLVAEDGASAGQAATFAEWKSLTT
ncbi:MAG TPA: MEKHLA domain-containing protein [Planctomycetaceae bacterium]|nr:MEKHLA domain-containing protein [Planctomycetaceae bacterium]